MSVLQYAVVLELATALALSLFSFLGFSLHADNQVHVSHHGTAVVHRLHGAASSAADRTVQDRVLAAVAGTALLLAAASVVVRVERAAVLAALYRLVAVPRGPPAALALA